MSKFVLLLAASAYALAPGMLRAAPARSRPVVMESLAAKMFGTLVDGVKGLADTAGIDLSGESSEPAADPNGAPGVARPTNIEGVVSDVDARAQTGALTFADFMTMAKAYQGMSDERLADVLPGTLSAAEMEETRQKFGRHISIVEVMLPDEKVEPSLLIEDLKV